MLGPSPAPDAPTLTAMSAQVNVTPGAVPPTLHSTRIRICVVRVFAVKSAGSMKNSAMSLFAAPAATGAAYVAPTGGHTNVPDVADVNCAACRGGSAFHDVNAAARF